MRCNTRKSVVKGGRGDSTNRLIKVLLVGGHKSNDNIRNGPLRQGAKPST